MSIQEVRYCNPSNFRARADRRAVGLNSIIAIGGQWKSSRTPMAIVSLGAAMFHATGAAASCQKSADLVEGRGGFDQAR